MDRHRLPPVGASTSAPRRRVAKVIVTVQPMIDAIPPAQRRPPLERREPKRQLLAVDKPRTPARQQRERLNINLRPVALAVGAAHLTPPEALGDKPRRVFVAHDRLDAVAAQQPANLGDGVRRREGWPHFMRKVEHNLIAVLMRDPNRETVLPSPARRINKSNIPNARLRRPDQHTPISALARSYRRQ